METQGRRFGSALPDSLLETIQVGVLRTRYREAAFLKSPFDVVLYLQLLGRAHIRSVIEIGSKAGGSALWFADMLSVHGVAEPRVLSVDLLPPSLADPRITFLRGDASALDQTLGADLLATLPRPWLVVEDSSHLYTDVIAVLEFFHAHLEPGDYIVVEDGVVSQLPGDHYRRYEDGPNRAVGAFLAQHSDSYAIDESLCDHYGFNVTYNPNAWIRRVRQDP